MSSSPFKPMTAKEVMKAVDEGHTVYADSHAYRVVKTKSGQYHIVCGTHRIGLTWEDGVSMNARKFHVYSPQKQENNQVVTN